MNDFIFVVYFNKMILNPMASVDKGTSPFPAMAVRVLALWGGGGELLGIEYPLV